jgi:hypothetical protein
MEKKKYHHSKRHHGHHMHGSSAHHKDHGMKMHHDSEAYRDREMYAGKKMRSHMDRENAHMIGEDHNAIANMPQHVVMRSWPKGYDYVDYHLDDTISGIDTQRKMDSKFKKDRPHPEMF